ncbi:MAG: hypothetical protein RLZZ182_413 [Pseudomonadota bacterium]|jgi:hypothetical protein
MSESDRELLEKAARAAGIAIGGWNGEREAFYVPADGYYWNPRTDDGDALRLGVKLRIDIRHDEEIGETLTAFMAGRRGLNLTESWGPMRDGSQDNPTAATRRAIVRAAAAIWDAQCTAASTT